MTDYDRKRNISDSSSEDNGGRRRRGRKRLKMTYGVNKKTKKNCLVTVLQG